MQEIDRVLKILSGRFPNAFLKLLFRDRTYIILSRLEDTQLNIPEYRSDKISRLKHYDKKNSPEVRIYDTTSNGSVEQLFNQNSVADGKLCATS